MLEAFASGGIDERRYVIIPLHGLLEDKQQDLIFVEYQFNKSNSSRTAGYYATLLPLSDTFEVYSTSLPLVGSSGDGISYRGAVDVGLSTRIAFTSSH